ncbi:YlxM family DNA-binding protein [Anaerovorax odorimutans]|nr:YlxM family DNA-binding protein [Anaerovorax odorimutans]
MTRGSFSDKLTKCQAKGLVDEGKTSMKLDEITQISLLHDFYGQLLTKRQQEVMELYHEENLSLSEIAQEFSISRQGVHDALKNAEKALLDYEQKLRLVEKFQKSRQAIHQIDGIIDEMVAESRDEQLTGRLRSIKTIIDELDQ